MPRSAAAPVGPPLASRRSLATARGLGGIQIQRQPRSAAERNGDGEPAKTRVQAERTAEPPPRRHPPRECLRGMVRSRPRNCVPGKISPAADHDGGLPRARDRIPERLVPQRSGKGGQILQRRTPFSVSGRSTSGSAGAARGHLTGRARPLRNPIPRTEVPICVGCIRGLPSSPTELAGINFNPLSWQ